MAILDADLLAAIQSDIAAGLGARLITQRLNAPGGAQVQAWVVAEGANPVDKELFLQQLTMADAAGLQTVMDSDTTEGKALKFKLSQSESIDMSQQGNRDFVGALGASGAISPETQSALLRLGEVDASRAQELWGEVVTIKQVKVVLGGA